MTVLFYYETAGARDTVSLIRPIEEFYNSHFEEPEFSTLAISRQEAVFVSSARRWPCVFAICTIFL